MGVLNQGLLIFRTFLLMSLFFPPPGGGETVNHGYKGMGVVMHLLADGSGKPLAIITTPANGNERLQVKTLLN